MKVQVEAINHVCIVVTDLAAAENFYGELLGFPRHHRIETWRVLNGHSTLHLVHIPEAGIDNSLYHEIQHFALQVTDLQHILRMLLQAGKEPFQMDFDGNLRPVQSETDALEFGLGTLFVYDPDGNLVEFLEEGRGIFVGAMRPQL